MYRISLRSWQFWGRLMNMEEAEPGVEKPVSQFFPSHSTRGFAVRFRGFAVRFRGFAAQTPTKPPATEASIISLKALKHAITKGTTIKLSRNSRFAQDNIFFINFSGL